MDHATWVTEQFEANRPRLRAVAYRMLGAYAEADDAVQEAWLRLARDDRSDVENLSGWLTTVVSRVCLDRLRSRKSRREDPAGAQRPEPDRWADRDDDPSIKRSRLTPSEPRSSCSTCLHPRSGLRS
jgi:RNA polymerase sigma-70 factor, ECF subfamily